MPSTHTHKHNEFLEDIPSCLDLMCIPFNTKRDYRGANLGSIKLGVCINSCMPWGFAKF